MPGLDLSLTGSVLNSKFDSTVADPALGAMIGGIRDGNRLPTVPKFQIAGERELRDAGSTRHADGYVSGSVQHVGSRYTQPSDQENNPRTFAHGLLDPATAVGDVRDRHRLSRCRPTSWSTCRPGSSGTTAWRSLLYVNNLFDKNAMLSFDRERGGRARLGFNVGQPRTIGMTVRRASATASRRRRRRRHRCRRHRRPRRPARTAR